MLGLSVEVSSAVMTVLVVIIVVVSGGAVSSSVEKADVVGKEVWGVSEMISSVGTGVLDASVEVM